MANSCNNHRVQEIQMGKLTEKEYWDSIYKLEGPENGRLSFKKKLKNMATRFFGKYIHNYSDYFLWEVIYNKYLPKTKGLKVLEVGSAPGTSLVRLHRTFGFVPYGVEYSEDGVTLNRKIFASNNIDPNNVIKADLFSDSFQNQYKEYFDIVFSLGFIEHFTDVEQVIAKHINLLTEAGYLVVSIPNLRGINSFLAKIFDKKTIAMHNIGIMEKKEFSELFDKERLSPLFCDYYGTFNFGLFCTDKDSPLRFLRAFCKIIQLMLNIAFHILLRNKGAENRLFSPYLIYIGVRK